MSFRFELNALMPLRLSVGVKESGYLFLSYVSASLGLVAVVWAVVGAIGAPYEDRTD